MNALPQLSKIEPKNPIANNFLLNVSTSYQYHEAPTIRMKIETTIWDENAIVIESNPIDGFVKCLMNRALNMKMHGVKIPKKTAIHFGVTYLDPISTWAGNIFSVCNLEGSAALEKEISKADAVTDIIPIKCLNVSFSLKIKKSKIAETKDWKLQSVVIVPTFTSAKWEKLIVRNMEHIVQKWMQH